MLRMKMLLLLMVNLGSLSCVSQEILPLYKGAIPNSIPSANEETSEQTNGITIIRKISVPTIAVYPAPREKNSGTAVIIFPGGGYWVNANSHEGTDIARLLNEWGISAFVVKYRIPDPQTMKEPYKGPLQDAQQAMLMVRTNAQKWSIDSNRIGIMGFSAGGHLASSLGVHYDQAWINNPGNISLRPDFMILGYPVISSDTSISHRGSFVQLIGRNPPDSLLHYFSSEKQVTRQTPPCFLLHASDDDVVPVQNSVQFYNALINQQVSAEMHIYQRGGHGFGLNNPTTDDQWITRCRNWLISNGWLKK